MGSTESPLWYATWPDYFLLRNTERARKYVWNVEASLNFKQDMGFVVVVSLTLFGCVYIAFKQIIHLLVFQDVHVTPKLAYHQPFPLWDKVADSGMTHNQVQNVASGEIVSDSISAVRTEQFIGSWDSVLVKSKNMVKLVHHIPFAHRHK